MKNVDLTKVHNLSGPIAVEGAEPGDCLVVDILDGEFRLSVLLICHARIIQRSNIGQSDHLIRCLGAIR